MEFMNCVLLKALKMKAINAASIATPLPIITALLFSSNLDRKVLLNISTEAKENAANIPSGVKRRPIDDIVKKNSPTFCFSRSFVNPSSANTSQKLNSI